MENGKLVVRVENEEIEFGIFHAMHHPIDKGKCFQINILEEICSDQPQADDSWDMQELNLEDEEKDKLVKTIFDDQISPITKPEINQGADDKKEQELELKELPSHLNIWRFFHLCLKNLEIVLGRCVETNLILNWKKCHLLATEGIVLAQKFSRKGIEADKAKVEVIEKLTPPTNDKCIRIFLGKAGFYRRFIKDFSKTAKPLCNFLLKDSTFNFDES
ncbi:PREDICTED: uncharacterized protein LOC109359632 [Lupinus angustifolius]|uniref:uncharacterized protein LOC109359632 n=1 Tax=Lupinus angustifolius TaxID=3871 RepID=UPI00092FABC7|nr:PREDICTED: uncharacterized protein LOC109359632 [Lupinus angustifolius]